MESPRRWWLHAVAVCAALFLFASPTSADAGELAGQVTDAATGVPIEGATVRVMGTEKVAQTDADGSYAFDVPDGTYELEIEAKVGSQLLRSRYVNQRVPQTRLGRPHVFTDHFLEQGHEALEYAVGLPSFSGRAPADGPDSIDIGHLFDFFTGPTALTVPSTAPSTIRVGRRQDHTGAQGCTDSSNPIVGIDEMHLDEYVKGVLPPEIGVFQSISGASEVYKTFAIAAKSYALYFMLRYDSSNRRTLGRTVDGFTWFHIDDTACNQRYSDDRMAITTNAAVAVQNKILVKASDPNNLEKYEYAASCGRHGTRPEHQTAIVSDSPPQNACAGSWCGHDNCAAHEDHPDVPGSDRCLVRGICQWGAISWGKSGKNYTWLLDHYQPNLQVRELVPSGPATVVLTGYAYTNPDDIAGSAVTGVDVSLSDGQSTTTDADGTYRFDAVRLDLGTVDITATKSGYETATRSKELESGAVNWGSILMAEGTSSGGEDTGGVADAGQQPGDDAGIGSDVGQPGADTGSSSDIGDDAGDNNNSRGLGPLVKASRGVNGGCATQPSNKPSVPALLGLAVLALALLGLTATRRQTSR
jgi:MYXO-CTERM domain-containing protein